MAKLAAIYCRLSVDRELDKASIERQEADCRALATARGFEVADDAVFVDRNLSAFNRGVVRPGYENMKDRVTANEFDAVFAYRLDRLSRSLSEALKLIELLDDHKTGLVMVNGHIDTTGPMGKAFFQISAIFAELEAATTSDRLKGYNLVAAAKGEFKTGGRRPYGYISKGVDKGQIVPEEADFLHVARSLVMADTPIRETARQLNTAGSRTTTGAEWSPRSLVKCLKSPRLRAKRIHLGQLTDGDWPAIFTEDEQLTLIAKINASAETYRSSTQRVGNQHLLTGLAICGICGGRLGYNRSRSRTGDVVHPRYQCVRAPGGKGCGSVSVDEAKVDTYVIGIVREFGHMFMEHADVRRRELVDQMAQDQIDLVTNEQSLADLFRDRYAPDSPLSDDLYADLRTTLLERISNLRQALSQPAAELEQLPKSSWERGPLTKLPQGVEGREWLRYYLKAVEIMPARKRGVRFDGSRVRLHWVDGRITNDDDYDLKSGPGDTWDTPAWPSEQ